MESTLELTKIKEVLQKLEDFNYFTAIIFKLALLLHFRLIT